MRTKEKSRLQVIPPVPIGNPFKHLGQGVLTSAILLTSKQEGELVVISSLNVNIPRWQPDPTIWAYAMN